MTLKQLNLVCTKKKVFIKIQHKKLWIERIFGSANFLWRCLCIVHNLLVVLSCEHLVCNYPRRRKSLDKAMISSEQLLTTASTTMQPGIRVRFASRNLAKETCLCLKTGVQSFSGGQKTRIHGHNGSNQMNQNVEPKTFS